MDIFCTTNEESKIIQEFLIFRLGFDWVASGKKTIELKVPCRIKIHKDRKILTKEDNDCSSSPYDTIASNFIERINYDMDGTISFNQENLI